MTGDASATALATIADALARMHDQVDELTRANRRIEANQDEILRRLDQIGEGQATIAQIAAYAHAASIGNSAALPTEVISDPLLERFVLNQPADRRSTTRALVDWRRTASSIGSAELARLLTSQYRPSPSDTSETRLLRYQLAAIGREELRGRGENPPAPPSSTLAQDRSTDAVQVRSAELAMLWRAGGSAALYAEPELAGALDLFAAAELRGLGIPDGNLSVELAQLHRVLGDRIAVGDRPSASKLATSLSKEIVAALQGEKPR
ncbi:hypothetical protein H5J25_20115 (plasmid) [Sphingomonas aliaeris]|uniref:Uncharacterized protein n=1 Tax=Sphingomonas aliaeris TaxID=2759526 RepID=A0A974NYU7_9SPHN|nr:hypothetical protein [Sphingomonas aliaeris]QQV79396.1 hypothetical protein H5J25_20115 [Sphingomonas aliaeris]